MWNYEGKQTISHAVLKAYSQRNKMKKNEEKNNLAQIQRLRATPNGNDDPALSFTLLNI